MKPLFSYKFGDVPTGNWMWAIGAKAPTGDWPLCVATINFHGALAAGYDPEKLAAQLAEAIKVPDPDPVNRACPECGDADHLYFYSASVRWDPETNTWGEPINDEDELECTECDWHGPEEETEVKTDGL